MSVRLIFVAAGLMFVTIAEGVSQNQRGASTLLPASATKYIVKSHGIEASVVGGYWQPTAKELADLETNIPKIAGLRSEGALLGMQIAKPTNDNRQYVALIINGKKAIYIHGFCMPPSKDWTSRLEVIMDGGTCVWNALYDVGTESFSHLTTNGRA